MRRKIPLLLIVFLIAVSGCRKENFVEPPDPFSPEKLNPEHKAVQLGEGENALTLLVNNESFFEKEKVARIKGSFFVHNALFGDLRISSGDFTLTKNDAGNYTGFEGIGLVELPNEGPFADLGIIDETGRKFGFKKGSEFDLDEYPWPVNENRYYFYIDTQSGLEAKIYDTSIKNITRLAIDPTDPYIFMTAQLSRKGEDLGEFGIGCSAQKLIPFRPVVEEYTLQPFFGELYLSGEIELKRYPVTLWGESVFSFGEGAMQSFFSGENSAYTMGLNGKAFFRSEALDWLDVDVELGRASLTLDIHDDGYTQLKFAGVRETPPESASDFLAEIIGEDWNFVDYVYPFEQKEIFYGTLGSDPDDWEIGFDMESHLKIFDNDIDMGRIHLLVTDRSLDFAGSMPVNVIGRVGVSGSVERNGNFMFSGYGSADLDLSAGPLSLRFSAGLNLALTHIDAVFTITGRVHLEGSACAEIAGTDVCVSIAVNSSVTIRSDGYFQVCFSIGIDGVGFDVCIEFTKEDVNGKTIEIAKMTQHEIPIESVPPENRFYSENYRGEK